MLLWRWRIAKIMKQIVNSHVWSCLHSGNSPSLQEGLANLWFWQCLMRRPKGHIALILMHGEQTWKSCGHVGRRRISFVYVCEREIWFGALVIFNQMAACSKLLLMTAFYCPTQPNALHPHSGSKWFIHIDICRNGLVESCFCVTKTLGLPGCLSLLQCQRHCTQRR